MHPTIYKAFEDIVATLAVRGRVLEIGAIPSEQSLLAMGGLRHAERIGVNLEAGAFRDFDILACNANAMPMFPDGHFDCVLSNATIEHDRYFWRTCSEVRRVLRVGGAAVIGAPAFTEESGVEALGLAPAWEDDTRSWRVSALTFRFHGAPDDYYRFSPSAFRDVIFEGFSDVSLRQLMVPPRIIGSGLKQR